MNVENRLGIELSDKLSTGSKLRNAENGSLLVGSVNGSKIVVSEMRLSCVVTEELSLTPKMSTVLVGGSNRRFLSLSVKLAGKAGTEGPNELIGRNCGTSTGTSVLPNAELNTLSASPLFQESKELSGLDLPGKGKVGISLVLLVSGNSGKEPASILFERDPEDNGKGKVGISLVLLDSGNSGKEPALILFERDPEDSLDCVCGQCLVGSPEGFLDRISGQTSGLAVVVAISLRA